MREQKTKCQNGRCSQKQAALHGGSLNVGDPAATKITEIQTRIDNAACARVRQLDSSSSPRACSACVRAGGEQQAKLGDENGLEMKSAARAMNIVMPVKSASAKLPSVHGRYIARKRACIERAHRAQDAYIDDEDLPNTVTVAIGCSHSSVG